MAKPENRGRQQADTRFKPGQSGNPSGRPKGARHRTTVAIEALLEGEGEALTRKAIELAKAGDMQALRLCMDRLAPPRRDSPLLFDLPEMKTVTTPCMGADGDLTPREAAELSKTVANYAETVRVCEIEQRLADVERLAERKGPPRIANRRPRH
jgi:hypothetical protein